MSIKKIWLVTGKFTCHKLSSLIDRLPTPDHCRLNQNVRAESAGLS